VTKCGVGELSVVNAIAGAFSEYVPVIHIVGTPSAAAQTKDMLLQHTLSNGDTKVFESIAKQITCAITILDDSCDIAILIDEAIKDCWTQSRPVYISLPIDLVQKKVEGKRLKTRIDFSLRSTFANEEEVVKLILEQIYKASKPVILIDAGAYRRRVSLKLFGALRYTN
jgi:pyruvate decarboxylase